MVVSGVYFSLGLINLKGFVIFFFLTQILVHDLYRVRTL